MPREILRISSAPTALAWVAVAWMGGIASILALLCCWFFLGQGSGDSAEKHGISESLSSRVGGTVVIGYAALNLTYLHVTSSITVDPLSNAVIACFFCFFCVGIFEDLKGNTSARLRFGFMLLLALLFVGMEPQLRLQQVSIPLVDFALSQGVIPTVLFTGICLTFLANAFNVADGANGLVGGVGLVTLVTLALALPGPLSVLQMSTAVGCAVFLVFNIQTGRFFLGDGGAYGLGALIGCSMISASGVESRSTWFLLALVFYPVADLLWSMMRRAYSGVAVHQADNEHLHNLLYSFLRRWIHDAKIANNATGITIVTLFCLIPALFWWSGTTGVDDSRWLYIVFGELILYLFLWGVLRKAPSKQ